MGKTKVAVVDDHKILRDGLRLMLENMDEVEVIIEASNGKEFIDKLPLGLPDLAIIDINMPIMSGDKAIAILKEKYPAVKILVLSMNNEEQYFNAMNDLGVDGYIVKESDYNELRHAIQVVINGGKYFSQSMLLNMVNNRTGFQSLNLSDREGEVLGYLCKGMSAQEIGEKMFVSPRTVEKYRSDLLIKTGMPNSISLVVFAIKSGLVKL